jgi:hypothetical protein
MSNKDFKVKNKLQVAGITTSGPVVSDAYGNLDSTSSIATQYGGTGTTTSPTSGQILYSSAGTNYAPATLAGLPGTYAVGNTASRPGSPSTGQIYSNTEKIQNDKFLAGPMIPEDLKGFFSKKVVIEDDVLIGANAVILPGVFIGRGAVIGANAIITESVEPWSVVIDRGKKIYHRPPLSDNTIRNFDDND